MDPRTPVVVGVGQLNHRDDDRDPPPEPVDLIVEAVRLAETDSGSSSLLAAVDSIRVISMLSWRYRDPGALVAERLGIAPRDTAYSTPGGNTPQSLVNQTALDIVAGVNDIVVVAGAEAWRTRMAFRARGERPPWTQQDEDVEPARVIGHELVMSHPAELARGLLLPVQLYPMFEIALRAAEGLSPEAHLVRISELWSRFSEVAAQNRHAWIQRAFTPEEIRTPSPANRMIGHPYPKLMNSNNNVEQAAAVVLCSAERARALGVPTDRWVFPHSGTDAHDHPFMSNRGDLHSSPAVRIAGGEALELAGTGRDELAHVDLYSCFPSAVQVAAAELGLELDRRLTVTGGLSFAGGPWNNYVTHAIATMVEVLRDHPGSMGLCSANGGLLTKHAFGVYGTEPPASGFRYGRPQAEVDHAPRRELAEDHEGRVTVEAYTVMHDRDGAPQNALAACLLDDGRRAWGTTQDPDVMKAMTVEEWCGRAMTMRADGTLDA